MMDMIEIIVQGILSLVIGVMIDIEIVLLHEIRIPLAHAIIAINLVIPHHIFRITLLPHLRQLVLVMDILRINRLGRNHDLGNELPRDQLRGQLGLVRLIDDIMIPHVNETTVQYLLYHQDHGHHRIPLDEMTTPHDLQYDVSPLNDESRKINLSFGNLVWKV